MNFKRKFLTAILLVSAFVNSFSIPSFAAEDGMANIKSGYTVNIPKVLILSKDKDDTYTANYEIKINGDIDNDKILKIVPDENFKLTTPGKDSVNATTQQENTSFYNTQIKESIPGKVTADLSAGEWEGNLNFNITLEEDKNAYKYTTLVFNPENPKIIKNLEKEIKVFFNDKDVTDSVIFENNSDIIKIENGKIKALKEGTANVKVSYSLKNEDSKIFNNEKTVISYLEVNVIPCEHNFVLTNSTDATCVLDSTEEYECDICGETKTEHKTLATGHIEGNEVEVENIEPTCTQEGKIEKAVYCTVCNEKLNTITEIIPKLEHDFDEGENIEATCTEDGVKSYTCKVCGEEKTEIISKTGHTPGEFKTVKEASCLEDGQEVKECEVCGAVIETNTIPKLGHDLQTEEIDATCTKEGKKIISCSRCDYKEEEIIPLKEHTASDFETIYEPTCLEEGTKQKKCEVCGLVLETESIPKISHTKGDVVIENEIAATCTENGSYDEVTYCTVCNKELSRTPKTIKKLGHEYKDVVTEPTHSKEGYTTHTCTRCGDTYVDSKTDILPHTYDKGKVTKEPTCTEEGTMLYTCTCGETKTEAIKPTGHVKGEPVQENQVGYCEKEGSYDEVIYCEVCGEELSRTKKKTAALDHVWEVSVITPATCDSDSTEAYVCTRCDETKVTHNDKATGHVKSDITIIDPTCQEQGYTEYTCPVCGEKFTEDFVPSLTHEYGSDSNCKACQDFDVSKLAPGLYNVNNNKYTLNTSWANIISKGWMSVSSDGTLVLTGAAGNSTTHAKYRTSFGTETNNTFLVIDSSVKKINENSLFGLHLNGIYIPSSVTSFGAAREMFYLNSIYVANDSKYLTVEDGVLFNKDKTELILAPKCVRKDYLIPSTVKTVKQFAFERCQYTSIVIPEGVEKLEQFSMRRMNYVETIYIPSTVTSLAGAFGGTGTAGTGKCRAYIMDSNNTTYTFNDEVLYTSDMKTIISCPSGRTKPLDIPSTVTLVDTGACDGCVLLPSITMTDNVKEIKSNAFRKCLKVTEITLPKDITAINNEVFSGTPLNDILIPSGVKSIGTFAFTVAKKVTFEDSTSYWKVTKKKAPTTADGKKIPTTAIQFNNPEQNAKYLNWSRNFYTWSRQ